MSGTFPDALFTFAIGDIEKQPSAENKAGTKNLNDARASRLCFTENCQPEPHGS
jgi:hypothetical protein